EDVQSPGHGWYEASHGRSPSLCVSGARCRSRRRVAGGAVPGAFDISTGDRNGEHRLTIRTSTGNGTGVPDGRRERRTSRPGGAVRGRAYGPGSTRRWSAAHAGVPQFAPQPLGAQDEFQLEAAVRVVYLVAPQLPDLPQPVADGLRVDAEPRGHLGRPAPGLQPGQQRLRQAAPV